MSNELNQGRVQSDQKDRVDECRDELAGYLKSMKDWDADNGDFILQEIASMHARAASIRHWLHNQKSQKATKFRQNELKDFIDTCDFQFRVYSRIQSVRQSEMNLSRGF